VDGSRWTTVCCDLILLFDGCIDSMRELSQVLFLCFAACLSACNRSPSYSPAAILPLPTVDAASASKAENQMGVLDLPDGSKFRTTLYDLKVIGQLRTVHKLPYYVLSGVGCEECDANASIYIHSPSDGPMQDEGTQQRFDYPGREFSREDHRVDSKTRMFIGNCAPGYPDAVIWFYHSLGEDKLWHDSVLVAHVKDDHLVDGTPNVNVPTFGEAEEAVRKSRCREMSGMDQWEEP